MIIQIQIRKEVIKNVTHYHIDTSGFQQRYARLPLDSEMGAWTFIINGEPMQLFGAYAETQTLAKFYARMREHEVSAIELNAFGVTGRVHENLS